MFLRYNVCITFINEKCYYHYLHSTENIEMYISTFLFHVLNTMLSDHSLDMKGEYQNYFYI